MTDDNFGSSYGRSSIGMIMDHNDPKQMGRYLVKWYSSQEGLNPDELQWCYHRANQGQGPGNQGMFFGLRKGGTVTGTFHDGDSQIGMVTGVNVAGDTSGGSGASSMQSGGQQTYQPDLPAAAMTGGGQSGSQAQQGQPNPDNTDKVRYPGSTYNSQYPFHDVIKGEGYELHLDSTPGSERIRMSHVSGSHYEMSATGKYTQMTTDHHLTYHKGGRTHTNDGPHDEKHDDHFRSSITLDAHHEIAGDHQQAHGLNSKQIHGGDYVKLTGGDHVHGIKGNQYSTVGANTFHKTDGSRQTHIMGNNARNTAGTHTSQSDQGHTSGTNGDMAHNAGGAMSRFANKDITHMTGGSFVQTATNNRTINTGNVYQHNVGNGAAIASKDVSIGPGAQPGLGIVAPLTLYI